MSKLPRTDELPHADEGFDPARVEEAFATFADRVRELESVASELRAELYSLRVERSSPSRFEDEDWPAVNGLTGPAAPAALSSADWVATVPPPLARGLTVPRLAIEGAFLLLVALLAGLADLRPAWIVLVMVVAWALVALAEWAAAAKRSHWRLDEVAPPTVVPGPDAADSTGPWDMPVVESTAVESPEPPSESQTIVTTLPTKASPRRLGLRRRKQPAEAAADPWET
ncbi:MAG TPA: hypothetical protein VM049_12920 [Gaiellaceae bacterium]|nr:hypothetical protein [Gaiellaceae bacterium]